MPVNWRKLRTFVLTVLVLCLIPATRYYQIDQPVLRYLRGTREVDPLSLQLSGEFVENNLGTEQNADGSVTVWFGPKAPAGQEANWVQTMPGKGWNSLLRLYAPLQPWFDKTWKPGDFELVE